MLFRSRWSSRVSSDFVLHTHRSVVPCHSAILFSRVVIFPINRYSEFKEWWNRSDRYEIFQKEEEVAGQDAHICDQCIEQAFSILNHQNKSNESSINIEKSELYFKSNAPDFIYVLWHLRNEQGELDIDYIFSIHCETLKSLKTLINIRTSYIAGETRLWDDSFNKL